MSGRGWPLLLDELSLVKGVNLSKADTKSRAFESVYYLGGPDDLSLSDLDGCVVVFNDAPEKKFESSMTGASEANKTSTATGTCDEVIDEACLYNITQRVDRLMGNHSSNFCQVIEHELKKNDFQGCSGFGAHGETLGNFSIKSLKDLQPVKNSSDCWPVFDKSDQLFKIGSDISYVSFPICSSFHNTTSFDQD